MGYIVNVKQCFQLREMFELEEVDYEMSSKTEFFAWKYAAHACVLDEMHKREWDKLMANQEEMTDEVMEGLQRLHLAPKKGKLWLPWCPMQ